ncbi:MAG: cell wall-binding repeat-containing protein [Lachnospiraceae bacterium]|nr:cell wall-binding repeat-containing protein [Lachnospiraceae bacterium]
MRRLPPRSITQTVGFIRDNLTENGIVYILGGTGAVPASVEDSLSGIEVKRLSGKDRYKTNMLILNTAGISRGTDLLIASGDGFADALSASALGKPIMLVGRNATALTDEQKAFVTSKTFRNIYILGGSGAIKDAIVDEIKALKPGVNVERVKGSDRYATSLAIATKFFASAENITIATGENFPDGLSGGPLAYALGAPMVLVRGDRAAVVNAAAQYADQVGAARFLAFGGSGVVSDAALTAIAK